MKIRIFDDYNGRMRNDNLTCTLTSGSGRNAPRNGQKVVFFLDKNIGGGEITMANTLTSREDRGVSKQAQTGTAVAIPIKEATVKGYAEATVGDSVNIALPDSETRRGRVGKQIANTIDTNANQAVVVETGFINPETDGSCRMLKAQQGRNTFANFIRTDSLGATAIYAVWYEAKQCYVAIRKLTPKECFRLQGWSDDYFEKAAFVNFDSQLYKQAGNGVTVNVAEDVGNKIKEAKTI